MNAHRKDSEGHSKSIEPGPKKIISWLTVLFAFVALSGCEQARVDAQMEALCKQDGGMKIYETVVLPKEDFKYGVPIFYGVWDNSINGFRHTSKNGEYEEINKFEVIKVEKPIFDILTWNHANLTRHTFTVIRKADKKILGTYVYYSRIGGAIIPRLGPDPSKGCPTNGSSNNFLNTVFVKQGEMK